MKDGLLYTIRAKNIKAIKDFKALDINGDSILLVADNNCGKSTIIQCLNAIAGDKKALDELELHFGTDSGFFETTKGINGEEYLFRISIEKGKAPELTMKKPDGVPVKTRSLIMNMVKGVPFDVWEFVRWSQTAEGKRKQVDLVRKFLSEEENNLVKGIEKRIDDQYKSRTAVNAEADRLKAVIEKSELTAEDYKAYSEKVSISEAQAAYDKLIAHNSQVADVKTRFDERLNRITSLEDEIADLEERLKLTKATLATEKITQDKALAWLNENIVHQQEVIQAAKQKVASVSDHNTMVDRVNAKKLNEKKLEELRDQSEGLTVTINSSRTELERTIKEIGLPVPDLMFTSDELLYKNLPVDENHQSFSEIVMLSARIKVALNPENPVLCIENVESLGSEKYQALLDLRKSGFQIIGEHMERGVQELTYKIIPG